MHLSECTIGKVVCEYEDSKLKSPRYAFKGSKGEYLLVGHIIGFRITETYPINTQVQVQWNDGDEEVVDPKYLVPAEKFT